MNTPIATSNRSFLDRVRAAAIAFVSEPASARPLAALRIGLAAVLLLQALALGEKLLELYGPGGIIQWPVVEAVSAPGVPRIGWLATLLAPLGVTADACVIGVFLVYVGSLSCLLVGWHTPLAALLASVAHLAMTVSGNAAVYGVDEFATIGLFYCVCLPVADSASMDVQAGRRQGTPSAAARLGLRLLQIHLCIVYFASGIEKASGEQWWNGEAIWRALFVPTMASFDFGWLAQMPWLAKLICWGTLLVEIGYAFLVWPCCTRKFWALATVGLHLGIAVTMGLVSFSAVMIVLTASAFLVSGEPTPTLVAEEMRNANAGTACTVGEELRVASRRKA
jgi:hypothetical protein